MSKYTTEFRYLLEGEWTDEKLGLADYPIFDESYREHLNNIIKEYYYTDEIGYETPYLFALKLKNKMKLIMPMYNQLYRSALIDIDPMLNVRTTANTVTSVLEEIKNTVEETFKSITDRDLNEKTNDSGTTDKKGETTTKSEESKNTDTKNESSSRLDYTQGTRDTTNTRTDTEERENKLVQSGTGDDNSSIKNNQEQIHHDRVVHSDTPNGLLNHSDIDSYQYADTAQVERHSVEYSGNPDTNNTHHVRNYTDTTTSRVKNGGTIVDQSITKQQGMDVTNGKNTDTVVSAVDSTLLSGGKTEDFIKTLDEMIRALQEVITQETLKSDTGNTNKSGDTDTVHSNKGFSGITMSEMLIKYRETFINIDSMVLDALSDLFIFVLC